MTTMNESKPTVPFPPAEYADRIRRFVRLMKREKLDSFVVATEVNRLYFTGFRSSSGILVITRDEAPVFFTDFRYIETARSCINVAAVRRSGDRKEKPFQQVGLLARSGGWKKTGFEGAVSAASFKELGAALPAETSLEDFGRLVHCLRSVKSRREQSVIRRAARLADMLFSRIVAAVRPGMSEWDIRRLIRSEIDHLSQGESFPCIVCAGSNASKCHHEPSGRILRPGQGLLLDLGLVAGGYLSDMTRTVFYGRPSRLLRKIHSIVLEANRRAIEGVRAGRRCCRIDAIGRRVIEKAGYGRYFGHSLGHGLGLEIHENPSFSAKDKTRLKPGMTMTVEPGIYLPGVGGVRIEDMVLVHGDGCEVLTTSPRLVVIE